MSSYRSFSTVKLDPKEYSCGLFGWRPEFLQRLATTRVFLLVFACIGVIQGANFTYMIGSITTLEKRFAFGSQVSGLILMTDNLMQLIANPLFGYLANRVHRPRMIGICQLIVVFGCYLAAVPYFLYEYTGLKVNSRQVVTDNSTRLEYCDRNGSQTPFDSTCDTHSGVYTVIPAVVIFCLSSCCNGIGFTAFYIIGIPFIDDNVQKKNSPLYISTTAALRLCGPTLGYFLSAFVLRFYENPFIEPGITMEDPRWVGAWWLGFVILGTGVLICSIPMFFFPKNFKSSPLLNRSSYITIENSDTDEKCELWSSLKRLVSNPILICYTFGTTVNLFALFGYLTFLSKYMESEYKRSASEANLFSGIIGVAPAAVGIFIGGVLIRQFRPKAKLLTSMITVFEIMGLIGIISAMFMGCPQTHLNGHLQNGQLNLFSECNNQCHCSTRAFQPLCGPDGKTNYFSPCFAGCKAPSVESINTVNDCQCFPSAQSSAQLGFCSNRCQSFTPFASLIGLGNFVGNLAKTGNSIIAFRIVDERDKSFALGLSGAFMNIFAFIPYPVIYGTVTDSACLVWEQTCEQRGNCWLYSSDKFRYSLHGLTLFLLCMAIVFDIIVVLLSDRIKNLYDDQLVCDCDHRSHQSSNLFISSGSERTQTHSH